MANFPCAFINRVERTVATRAVKYHNLKAAADLLSCSVSQVYNYIAADRIVAVKMDGKTLISDEEIARFQSSLPRMVSRMKPPGAKPGKAA